jgi:O-Antigen ligase
MRRFSLGFIVQILVAMTVVAFAAGSSSVAGVVRVGRGARWVTLFLLLTIAVIWAVRLRSMRHLRRSVIAASSILVLAAVESTWWSVDPRLTFERASTFVALFVTAAALAAVSVDRPNMARCVLGGIVIGAVIVTILGLIVLLLDHSAAVQPATYDVPARYRGFGLNPDTVSLLLALCLPLALWFAFTATSRRELVWAVAATLGFDASIAASGSRGGIVAGFAGALVVAALAPIGARPRLMAAAAVLAMGGITIGVALAPTSKGNAAKPKTQVAQSASVPKPKPGYINVGLDYPFAYDIGFQGPGEAAPTHRTLFGLSGRGEAWRGTVGLIADRPLLGYGFGTEERVFIDRYTNFVGGTPEDSYLGISIELGTVGLVAMLTVMATLVVGAFRDRQPQSAASLGVIAAALTLAVVQSYIYSVGDIGTVTVWVCAFLGGAPVAVREAT